MEYVPKQAPAYQGAVLEILTPVSETDAEAVVREWGRWAIAVLTSGS